MLPPEVAHQLGIMALENRLLMAQPLLNYSILETNILGLNFKNPIGLAAGFDKNAQAINALLAQGFGFVEAGTTTPLAQPGNPRPRLFRLSEDAAVINRLGFNNTGVTAFVKNFRRHDKDKGVAGANIGKNKDSEDAIGDYLTAMKAVYPYADYIAVNISSPNTMGLRDLQKSDALAALLDGLMALKNMLQSETHRTVPVLLKIAPDLELQEKAIIAKAALLYKLDGLIISNTTISRPESLRSRNKNEQGGLSGNPVFELSTQALSDMYRLTEGKLPIIGVGGVSNAQNAYAKIRAGASLVQLYTALVYQGFGIVRDLCDGLVECLQRDGFSHISEAVGANHARG